MKYIITTICSFLLVINSYTQELSSIVSKDLKPKAGTENIYEYRPFEFFKIPDTIFVSLTYKKDDTYFFENIQVRKTNDVYQFFFNTPDSIDAIVFSIRDKNNNTVDNNDEIGFVQYFYNEKGKIPSTAYIDAMDLLSYYAQVTLKLNREKLTPIMISLFEKAYSISLLLKKETSYRYYLTLLYQERKDVVKSKLLNYASEMAAAKKDESKWMNAIYIYRFLRFNDKQVEIEKKAIETYPFGKVAQNKFLDSIDELQNQTEHSIMANKAYYVNYFKDTSAIMKNTFYGKVTEMLLNNSEWGKLPKYEDLIVDKIVSTNMYNAFARNLLEKKDPTDSQLNIAKMVSLKSIYIIKKQLAGIEKSHDDGLLERNINRYTVTYANILFTLGEYDSAFYFINEIYRQSENVDLKFLEQYSLYSEKAKGDRFAYEFIVQRLLDGVSSTVMLNQMKSISVRLGISDTVYKSIKEEYDKASRQKAAADIKAKFGTPKSIGFTLKNLSGTSVSLSSFKNKIIVLDFWASWCLPCLASFPNMQKIINIYKEDKEVVFLFIDTWEQKGDAESNKKAKERALSILRTNNYTFEVLLDEKNKVANAFKLDAVPMTHIINKNGNIVFMGNTSDLSSEIEKAR